MMRVVLEQVALFLLPFLLFGLYLALRRRNPMRWDHWSDQAVWLVIGGLILAVGSLVVAGFTGDRNRGGFEPTHLENGRVVPGRFE